MTLLECIPLIAVMAGVTYLIRMLPITLVRGKLTSKYLKRLLYYIPYAVLSAMTIPAIFTSAGGLLPSLLGCAIGVLLAWKEKSLIIVALAACAGAWVTSAVMMMIG